MDVEKLIDRLKNYSIKNKALLNLQTVKDAAEALTILQAELEKVKAERDAAVSDLKTVMAYDGGNLDTCQFCKNAQCYARGGAKPCLPQWRGQKEE